MTEYVFTLSDKTPSVEINVKETAIAQGAGQDLYDRAKKELGYTGTFEEFLTKFKGERGEKGVEGKSVYELALENGFTGDLDQWLKTLRGLDGLAGRNGKDGKSAYELAGGDDRFMIDGVDGFLKSLIGATGAKGDKGDTGQKGSDGKSATVTIGTVTTGEAASVTNTGTTTEAVLNFVLPAGGGGQSNGLHTEIKTVPVTVNAQGIQTVEFEAKFAETPTLHGQPALMGAGENRFLYLLSVDKNGFTCRSNYFSAGVQTIHYAATGKLA